MPRPGEGKRDGVVQEFEMFQRQSTFRGLAPARDQSVQVQMQQERYFGPERIQFVRNDPQHLFPAAAGFRFGAFHFPGRTAEGTDRHEINGFRKSLGGADEFRRDLQKFFQLFI